MFDPAQLRNTQLSVKVVLMEAGLRRRYLDAFGHRSYYAKRDKIAPDPIDLLTEKFPVTALIALGDYQAVYERLHLQPHQILQSQASIELIEDISVNAQIEITTIITDLYEQQATHAPLGFVVVDVFGKRKRKLLFRVTRTTAVRGGFSRSGT